MTIPTARLASTNAVSSLYKRRILSYAVLALAIEDPGDVSNALMHDRGGEGVSSSG
jgi:hypothetical protein